jgi:hypothetical protein
MIRRVTKEAVSGWRPWAIGAALSLACAAFLFVRREMAASQAFMDDYEAWWQQRAKTRANGHQPPPRGRERSDSERSDNPHLFV